MTKNEQLKVITEAYAAIPDLQDGFYDVRDRLFNMNADAERQHRKGAPVGTNHGISVPTAAKLFVVSHLLDGHKEPDKWDVNAILHVRTECLYAQAYAKKHFAEFTSWAAEFGPRFEGVDYAELMKG